MKKIALFSVLMFLTSCVMKKGSDGKLHYIPNNPLEELAEASIKYGSGGMVDVNLSGVPEKNTIWGIDTSHFFDHEKNEEKTEVHIESKPKE